MQANPAGENVVTLVAEAFFKVKTARSSGQEWM